MSDNYSARTKPGEGSLFGRTRCALVGRHKWDGGYDERIARCTRCGRFEDNPAVERGQRRRNRLRRWCPIWPSLSRRDLSLRLGLLRPSVYVSVRLHFGWDHTGELPGLHVVLTLLRFESGLSVGGCWLDEDGERRSLFSLWASFQTYGLRYIGCWLGHKPTEAALMKGHVYCDRCDVSLSPAERPEAIAE